MERYADEKNPEIVYRVVDVVEPGQSKPRRPLWRRFVRVLLTVVAVSMLWSTIAPVFSHTVRHHCGRNRTSQPPQDLIPSVDFDFGEPDESGKGPLQDYTFPPDIKNFWIKQESFHGVTRTQVVGNVIVHSSDKAQNISAHFKFDASDDAIRQKISIEPKKDGILFKLDPLSLVKQTVNATVYLVIPKKDDYGLKNLRIGTVELNVWLKDTFTTQVKSTYVSSTSGHVTALGKGNTLLNINNLKIKTTSGDIHGEFPLNHALALETTSGHIKADINSQDLRERKAWFKTGSVSGQTVARFISDLHPRPLYSKHQSVSGDISVYYPKDWQGALKLETTSGKIDVEGEGTKIIKKEKDVVKKLWKVIKGDGKSKGFVATVSGKIGVFIGILDNGEE